MKIIKVNKGNKKKLDLFAKKEWKIFNKERGYDWKETKFFFIAQDEGKILGFVHFKINGGAAYLSQLIVKNNQRGKGIGHLLIKKFEDLAKKKRCHLAYLETSEKHKEALKFYKKHNYKIVAKLKNNKFHLTWYFLIKRLK